MTVINFEEYCLRKAALIKDDKEYAKWQNDTKAAMRILSDALDEIAKLDLTLGDVLAVYGQALVGLASAAFVDE
jgi:hypothetical protein